MPTFYWVGNGCPKAGTSSTSHLWGTSEYHWNTPSNWVVAHSVHRFNMPGTNPYGGTAGPAGSPDISIGMTGGVSGATGPRAGTDTFEVFVEVYGTPNRAPGPGDTVYVGHYPWLMHKPIKTSGMVPAKTSSFNHIINKANHDAGFIVKLNDTFFDQNSWNPSRYSYNGGAWSQLPEHSAEGIYRRSSAPTDGAVLCVRLDPKRRTLLVPRGVNGTSNTPINTNFYATTDVGLGYSTPGAITQLYTPTPLTYEDAVSRQILYARNESISIMHSLSELLWAKNAYRNGDTTVNWQSTVTPTNVSNTFIPLPFKAAAPLLWGGCYSVTGATSEVTIQGGTGPVFWANAGASGVDVWGATSQALHELNVVMYGPIPTGAWQIPGDRSSMYQYQDIYPFNSVGDGLFGECYSTVLMGLQNAASISGGFFGYSCTGAATGQREVVNRSRVESRGITAEGAKAENLFVKTQNAFIYTPNEWNKLGGVNPHGLILAHNPVYTGEEYGRFNENFYVDASSRTPQANNWANFWLGGRDNNLPTRTDLFNNKFVQLRFADFTTGYTGSPGATAAEWNYGTNVYAAMPYGQFSMPYGKVQTMILGADRAGTKSGNLPSGLEQTSGATEVNTYISDKQDLLMTSDIFTIGWRTHPKFISNQMVSDSVWADKGLYFIGGLTGASYESRVNSLLVNGASVSLLPKTNVGYVNAYLGRGDMVEFMSKSLTSPPQVGTVPLPLHVQNAGKTKITHGYPQIANGHYFGATEGYYIHGSPLTGTAYYRPVVESTTYSNPVGKIVSVASGMNSQIGDMVLKNSNFILIDDDPIQNETTSGQKTIDRVIVQESATVDMSTDGGGYLHIGRILNAGSTGGTGSVYGGVLFESDSNCILKPAAGHRFWVSNINGKTTDSRQPNMLLSYVVSNPDVGASEFPSSLDNQGAVQSTSLENPYSPSSGYASTVVGRDGKRDMFLREQAQGDEFGEVGVA